MNLLILSLVIALLGEKTEKLQGGKKVGHERRIWKTHLRYIQSAITHVITQLLFVNLCFMATLREMNSGPLKRSSLLIEVKSNRNVLIGTLITGT